ncbi:annexin [Dawidia soli]|uniref:Annexin n=1 Tax=Dawidia soli TaxID=2782352 RepID=A0AAP2GEX1_9BACT|nr:annexin [Dawidia soli]MBT1688882.1 hypothetical protein [Dawidia soli]
MEMTTRQLNSLKNVAVGTLLATGTATGLFLVGRHFYRRIVSSTAQKHSLDEGDPATLAKQLKMAFENDNYFGWGSNEAAIFQVFNQLPSKTMYARVQKEYMNLYNRNLNADLEDELSSDEYNQLITILAGKK